MKEQTLGRIAKYFFTAKHQDSLSVFENPPVLFSLGTKVYLTAQKPKMLPELLATIVYSHNTKFSQLERLTSGF